MTHRTIHLAALLLWLLVAGCGPARPAASPVPPTVTLGAATTVPDTPTPAPSETAAYAPPGHTFQAEQAYGAYTVQLWRPEAGLNLLGVILAPGQPPLLVASVEALDPLSGGDVTGEGQPDVIFDLRDGGSHCCWGTAVYNLGAAPQLALEAWSGDRTYDRGSFVDLDGDGRLEFTIAHGVAQVPCTPPHVRVAMRYDLAAGRYVPAGPVFPAYYATDIAQARQAAATAQAETGSVDACRVLAVVLPLLYSGQTAEAWAEFERLYTAADAAELRADVESGLAQDPWFVPS